MLVTFRILTSMPKMVRVFLMCFLNSSNKQHATDSFHLTNAEHFSPLFEQIAKLDEALYNIQFEQHWLEAQTDRQAICKILLTHPLL
jgi:hypothetical protein